MILLRIAILSCLVLFYCVVASSHKTYYDILNISDLNAPIDDIKAQYRKLIIHQHPDLADKSSKTSISTDQPSVELLNSAYQVLRDAKTRSRYDYLLYLGKYDYDHQYDFSFIDTLQNQPNYWYKIYKIDNNTYIYEDQSVIDKKQKSLYVILGAAIFLFCCFSIPYYLSKASQQKQSDNADMIITPYGEVKPAPPLLPHDYHAKLAYKLQQEKQAQIDKDNEREYIRSLNQQQKIIFEQNAKEKHENKMKKQAPNSSSMNTDETIYKCKICSKTYHTVQQYDQHISSKQHLKKEKAKQA